MSIGHNPKAMSTSTNTSGFEQHNHSHCISNALAEADLICQQKTLRLTPLRRQVLGYIWQSHKPLGAYTLLEMLAASRAPGNNSRIAPPTVYRALEFLQAHGLVHRIASLNAYIGCCSPSDTHQSHFFICRHCNSTVELATPAISAAIAQSAHDTGFMVEDECVEVVGLCPQCQNINPETAGDTA